MMMKKANMFRYFREYGIKCTIASYLSRVFVYANNRTKWNWFILQYKNKTILSYLSKCYYTDSILNHQGHSNRNRLYSQCIWTAWLQGEENAPEVIELNISSMRTNSNGHKVIVITDDNVEKFIHIPTTIKQKHADGIMGHAHYADVIRMLILAKYGGIWLDATMFIHQPIHESAFISPFYSIGFEQNDKVRFISNHKWIVRIIGGRENSQYLSSVSNMLVTYWQEHDIPIDYFVFDYIIAVIYNNNESFRTIVDKLKKQKRLTNELSEIINEPYNEKSMKELLTDSQIYTLTYRKKYQTYTDAGLITNYGYLYKLYHIKNLEKE